MTTSPHYPLTGALSTIDGDAEAGEKLLWAADAALVCSTGDYWPYSDVLPHSRWPSPP